MAMASSSKATPPHSPIFTPVIPEGEQEEEEIESVPGASKCSSLSMEKMATVETKQQPTPLHVTSQRSSEPRDEDDARSVSCNKCRPSAREKICVVPLEINGRKRVSSVSSPIPNGIFKSIFSSLARKSPKSAGGPPASEASPAPPQEEQWKLALAELSHKLIQATRKRDEAVLEASRLKYSMAELEKKLNKLEIYCHDLKSGLDVCSSSPYRIPFNPAKSRGNDHHEQIVEPFLRSVTNARVSVLHLSRSLTLQLRQMGGKVYERISTLLLPYEAKISVSKNPRSLQFYLEALMNRAFYEDFESIGFQKNGADTILNPVERCDSNFASYTVLKSLSWDEVLTKGTKHFSENFSRFCDRKMSEIVGMLGWNRAWPEALLQAFFGAAKNVWLVHLLAFAVHPGLPIFRVEKGARYDGAFMEDMMGEKVRRLTPSSVRIMVAPGFYVYSDVVKCKVLCKYNQQIEGS